MSKKLDKVSMDFMEAMNWDKEPAEPIKVVEGRDVLFIHYDRQNDSTYVLARWVKHDTTEYITWGANRECNSFFWGHYFTSFEDAQADFYKRVMGL